MREPSGRSRSTPFVRGGPAEHGREGKLVPASTGESDRGTRPDSDRKPAWRWAEPRKTRPATDGWTRPSGRKLSRVTSAFALMRTNGRGRAFQTPNLDYSSFWTSPSNNEYGAATSDRYASRPARSKMRVVSRDTT